MFTLIALIIIVALVATNSAQARALAEPKNETPMAAPTPTSRAAYLMPLLVILAVLVLLAYL